MRYQYTAAAIIAGTLAITGCHDESLTEAFHKEPHKDYSLVGKTVSLSLDGKGTYKVHSMHTASGDIEFNKDGTYVSTFAGMHKGRYRESTKYTDGKTVAYYLWPDSKKFAGQEWLFRLTFTSDDAGKTVSTLVNVKHMKDKKALGKYVHGHFVVK